MAECPPVKRRVVGSSPTSAATPGWCNGSTGDFESLSEGSKPSPGSGVLAHLVERYHDTVEVAGSIPADPTAPGGVRGAHTTLD